MLDQSIFPSFTLIAWPYKIITLSDDQLHQRRESLDRYGLYAQLSPILPILIYQVYRFWPWKSTPAQGGYTKIPGSAVPNDWSTQVLGSLWRRWRLICWWLYEDMPFGPEMKGYFLAHAIWLAWLFFLCLHETGEDFLHVTKRFGTIAASQFPLLYILSMKSSCSPVIVLTKLSHEQLNVWHRVLARIINLLIICHLSCYLGYFIRTNKLRERFYSTNVLVGAVAVFLLMTIMTTSQDFIRRRSYRVFFIFHVVFGFTVLPLLWFHSPHLRIYLLESLAAFVFEIICRRLNTFYGAAIITLIPNTELIHLKIPIPKAKVECFQAAPAQHVYLSIPPESIPEESGPKSTFDFLFNPFTIADVSKTHIHLVVRPQNGPMTMALKLLASPSKPASKIKIEGPLGSTQKYLDLPIVYDRILLVAGGVGAAFTMPLFRYIKNQLADEAKSKDTLKYVWAIRSAAEANWAFTSLESDKDTEGIDFYFTAKDKSKKEQDELNIQMRDLHTVQLQRPDLKKIVDQTFAHEHWERVAILVCGPQELTTEMKRHVKYWVRKGRYIWFHEENFGW